MNYLLDTHILLWAAGHADRLPKTARQIIDDAGNALFFSAASLWEISIKNGLGRADFHVDPSVLRRGLFEHGYEEIAVTGAHAMALSLLPAHHKDPFDRMLIAQATVEGLTLLTADTALDAYGGPIMRV